MRHCLTHRGLGVKVVQVFLKDDGDVLTRPVELRAAVVSAGAPCSDIIDLCAIITLTACT